MERSYLLKPKGDTRGHLYHRFGRLEGFVYRLCKRCADGCPGFILTASDMTYNSLPGPKIGWGYLGDSVLMRISGCKSPAAIKAIEEFITKEGFEVSSTSQSRAN